MSFRVLCARVPSIEPRQAISALRWDVVSPHRNRARTRVLWGFLGTIVDRRGVPPFYTKSVKMCLITFFKSLFKICLDYVIGDLLWGTTFPMNRYLMGWRRWDGRNLTAERAEEAQRF